MAPAMDRSLFEELPPPQRLALSYAPSVARRPTLALLVLDARLGAALRQRGEPVLAQMRLAWWRDMLRSPVSAWPVGEAVLGLLRTWREPDTLISLVDGWEALLGEMLDEAAINGFASGRAQAFAQLARELGCDSRPAESSARLWALGDLAANLSDPAERSAAIAAADLQLRCGLPRSLRPLSVLAGLAHRSLEQGGTPLLNGPGALLRAVRLGITGR